MNEKSFYRKRFVVNQMMKLPCGHEVDRPISFQETIACPVCGEEYVLAWIKRQVEPPVRRRSKLTNWREEDRRRQIAVWERERQNRLLGG